MCLPPYNQIRPPSVPSTDTFCWPSQGTCPALWKIVRCTPTAKEPVTFAFSCSTPSSPPIPPPSSSGGIAHFQLPHKPDSQRALTPHLRLSSILSSWLYPHATRSQPPSGLQWQPPSTQTFRSAQQGPPRIWSNLSEYQPEWSINEKWRSLCSYLKAQLQGDPQKMKTRVLFPGKGPTVRINLDKGKHTLSVPLLPGQVRGVSLLIFREEGLVSGPSEGTVAEEVASISAHRTALCAAVHLPSHSSNFQCWYHSLNLRKKTRAWEVDM